MSVKESVSNGTKLVTVPIVVKYPGVIVVVAVVRVIPEVLIGGSASDPGRMNSSTQKFFMAGHGMLEFSSDSHSQYIWKMT